MGIHWIAAAGVKHEKAPWLALGLVVAACDRDIVEPEVGKIRIVNNSTASIRRTYIPFCYFASQAARNDQSRPDWGADIRDGAISAHTTHEFVRLPGCFDLRVEFSNGWPAIERYNIHLIPHYTFILDI